MIAKDIMTEVLYSEQQIIEKCKELAKVIEKDYENKDVIFICTLKGAVPFCTELAKHLNLPLAVEYLKASSYIGNQSSGNVKLTQMTNFEIKDKDILVIEDIVDTGLTGLRLKEFFIEKGAKSFEMVTLLNKECKRIVDFHPKYVGFEIGDSFVIGYGLDYNEKYRNIPKIGIMNLKYLED